MVAIAAAEAGVAVDAVATSWLPLLCIVLVILEFLRYEMAMENLSPDAPITQSDLTACEMAVLRYLSPLMEANATMIGEHLIARGLASGRPRAVGAALCGRLRRRCLVGYLPDLRAWRLTAAGRELHRRLPPHQIGNGADADQHGGQPKREFGATPEG